MSWRARGGIAFVCTVATGCAATVTRPAIPTREATPEAGVHVISRVVRYDVQAPSLRGVRQQMQRIGPIDDGGHQFAYTRLEFAWTYPFARDESGCATGPVQLEVEVVQTLPEWSGLDRANARAAAEWRRWQAATQAHEDGHQRIGMETAREIIEGQRRVGVYRTCEEVDAAANGIGAAALARMQERHRAYDRATRHGANDGATLATD